MSPQQFLSDAQPFLIDSSERRCWARQLCRLGGECQPVTALEAGNHWPIKTLDVSPGGVALLMSRRFEPGTFLAVTLSGPGDDAMSMPLARVCRVHRADQHWLLGCSWAEELESTEMRTLLLMPDRARVFGK